ncbi:zinc-binding dehydrogenase [Nocardioides antri]|uniref:Zinc-binding dehydrogenase n=1 Tax=Nocardioides antri TaxID=2607659 RepID=A0A5B1LXD8_9ACTN|nr:zinc-binding dehydrogenase [Nocardioides antri]KAA1424237.1 zinc-binding dehydrogenase [Nocardioides antri]
MKAAVVQTDPSAPPVVVSDVPVPVPPPDWVLVRLRAAALNRLDAMMLARREEESPGAIFGADGAGEVVEVGATARDSGVGEGDSVIISPSLFWGPSEVAPGPDYEILGSPTHGTHAEYVAVPVANVHPVPDHMGWAEAAALPMAGVTAWRALVTRGRLAAGETVVVGAASSGVGTMAIQIAAASGARVIAVTSTEEKAKRALSLGADTVVDRTTTDVAAYVTDVTDGGADLALDPTGALWQPMVGGLRPGGRLAVVGQAAAATGSLRVQSVYWKQVDILGSSMGSPRDFSALLGQVADRRWSPLVDSVHPLTGIAGAYARLDSPERIGKVVIDPTA